MSESSWSPASNHLSVQEAVRGGLEEVNEVSAQTITLTIPLIWTGKALQQKASKGNNN